MHYAAHHFRRAPSRKSGAYLETPARRLRCLGYGTYNVRPVLTSALDGTARQTAPE